MRTLSIQGLPDKRRQKVLVHDWPEPEGPTGNEVKTETIYSGITNGTERNQLIGGNYAPKDEQLAHRRKRLPKCGTGVLKWVPMLVNYRSGDVLYMSAVHAEYAVMAEDDLLIKLPDSVDRTEAALFGMTSVAMRTCRNTELKMGERVVNRGGWHHRSGRCTNRSRYGVRVPRSVTLTPTAWRLLGRLARLKPF